MEEYLVLQRAQIAPKDIEEALNGYAREGWRLVETVVSMGTTTMFIMARRTRTVPKDAQAAS